MVEIIANMTKYEYGEKTTPGYLSRPSDVSTHPGVIVIYEWWGPDPHVEGVADQFANEGYITLAPDHYHGKRAGNPEEARQLAAGLDREQAMREVLGAVDYLSHRADVCPEKIGVVGWGMGGDLAVSIAKNNENVGATVIYDAVIQETELNDAFNTPILGLLSEKSGLVSRDDIAVLDQKLKQKQIPHEIYVFSDLDESLPQSGNSSLDQMDGPSIAWKKTMDWLQRYLGSHPDAQDCRRE